MYEYDVFFVFSARQHIAYMLCALARPSVHLSLTRVKNG